MEQKLLLSYDVEVEDCASSEGNEVCKGSTPSKDEKKPGSHPATTTTLLKGG